MSGLDQEEVRRIAEELTAKYGDDALAFVTGRAERASAVGDEIAEAIWRKVLAAIAARLRR